MSILWKCLCLLCHGGLTNLQCKWGMLGMPCQEWNRLSSVDAELSGPRSIATRHLQYLDLIHFCTVFCAAAVLQQESIRFVCDCILYRMRANPKSMAAGLLKHVSSNSCRVKVPQTNKTWTRLVTVCAACPRRSDYPATPAMLTARQFLTVCDPEHCYFSGLGTSTSKGRMGLGYGGAF